MSDEAATNQQTRTVMSFPEAVAFNQGWNRGEAYGRRKALREAADALYRAHRAEADDLASPSYLHALHDARTLILAITEGPSS